MQDIPVNFAELEDVFLYRFFLRKRRERVERVEQEVGADLLPERGELRVQVLLFQVFVLQPGSLQQEKKPVIINGEIGNDAYDQSAEAADEEPSAPVRDAIRISKE